MKAGHRSTKVLIVLVVFPTSLSVFAILAHLPLAFIAALLPVGETTAQWAVLVVAYLLGGAGALWTCRFAWPKSTKSRNRDGS